MTDDLADFRPSGNWDFETGNLSCWQAEGNAFRNQPIYGDRITTARVQPVTLGGDYWDVPFPIGHHGDYWVGSAENEWGDLATGTLISQEFVLTTRYIHFLIGGTCDPKRLRVELQARAEDYARLLAALPGPEPRPDAGLPLADMDTLSEDGAFVLLFYATGHDSEMMRPETWDVQALLRASIALQIPLHMRVRIIDVSEHGHLNVDHFQFLDTVPQQIEPPLWGFADLHCHPMAHLAFGGSLFWGKPTDPVKKLLRCDGRGHGGRLYSGFVLHELEAQDDPRYRANRHPTCCWPAWNSRTHQEMHLDWIRRAHEGGLRLMCACAVNNQLLEHLMRAGPLRQVQPRDDLSAVLEQVEAMKSLARQEESWMEIAYAPAQARQIMRQGRLAIVLAVEVDQLGGWKREQDCTDEQVDLLVRELYEQGIRMLTPIHLANNAFGGAAIYDEILSSLNYYLNGEYFSVIDGHEFGVQFRLQAQPFKKVIGSHLPRIVRESMPIEQYLRVPPQHGHINQLGLTARGNFLIRALIRRGMLIDLDHMSHRATEETLSIAEQYGYAVIASHCTFRELSRSKTTEAMKMRQQVERIARLGGIVGLMPTQGEVYSVPEVLPGCNSRIANDCQASSKSWAQAYRYATYVMQDRGVALGTDMNGLVIKPRPRFSSEPEPGEQCSGQRNSVRYARYLSVARQGQPLTAGPAHISSVTRLHTPLTALEEGPSDINLAGLAHYGLLPDFLQDSRNIGLGERDLTPLFRSANDFIAMWERCERQSKNPGARRT